MSRKYPKSSRVCKSSNGRRRHGQCSGSRSRRWLDGEVQLPLNVEALLEMTREALSSFAVEMGLKVAQCLLADEVTQRCGQRHERVANRSETRLATSGASSRSRARRCRLTSRGSATRTTGGKRNSSGTSSCNRQKPCRKLPGPLGERCFDAALRAGGAVRPRGVWREEVQRQPGFRAGFAAEVERLAERRFEENASPRSSSTPSRMPAKCWSWPWELRLPVKNGSSACGKEPPKTPPSSPPSWKNCRTSVRRTSPRCSCWTAPRPCTLR